MARSFDPNAPRERPLNVSGDGHPTTVRPVRNGQERRILPSPLHAAGRETFDSDRTGLGQIYAATVPDGFLASLDE